MTRVFVCVFSCPAQPDGLLRPFIPANTFIGVYRGKFKKRLSARTYAGRHRSHAMETDDFLIVPEASEGTYGPYIDVHRYPIAAVNEVPEGACANTAFVRWYAERDIKGEEASASSRIDLISLYSARDLYENEELFAYYGSGYKRTWEHGTPAHVLKKNVLPPVMWTTHVPPDSWRHL